MKTEECILCNKQFAPSQIKCARVYYDNTPRPEYVEWLCQQCANNELSVAHERALVEMEHMHERGKAHEKELAMKIALADKLLGNLFYETKKKKARR